VDGSLHKAMLPSTCLMESITITYGAITYYFYIFHGIIYGMRVHL